MRIWIERSIHLHLYFVGNYSNLFFKLFLFILRCDVCEKKEITFIVQLHRNWYYFLMKISSRSQATTRCTRISALHAGSIAYWTSFFGCAIGNSERNKCQIKWKTPECNWQHWYALSIKVKSISFTILYNIFKNGSINYYARPTTHWWHFRTYTKFLLYRYRYGYHKLKSLGSRTNRLCRASLFGSKLIRNQSVRLPRKSAFTRTAQVNFEWINCIFSCARCDTIPCSSLTTRENVYSK